MEEKPNTVSVSLALSAPNVVVTLLPTQDLKGKSCLSDGSQTLAGARKLRHSTAS